MNIFSKYSSVIVLVLSFGLLLSIKAVATTSFYVLPNDVKHKVDCEYIEIKNNQVLCDTDKLLITYDLAQINEIEIIDQGASHFFHVLESETIKRINDFSLKKKYSEQAMPDSPKGGIIQKLSFDTVLLFFQSFKDNVKLQVGGNKLSAILLLSGFGVFLLGSFGYLIATFRVGIFWGLGCIFLPLVSFIFLFVHWKHASKPFFVTLLGIVIMFLGTMLNPTSGTLQNITTSTSFTSFNDKNQKENFQCRGKVYCSEMSSCAEAKFYLRNCPGTKLDGNNDGVPCEKQWCY